MDYASFAEKYQLHLTREQATAVTSPGGHTLLLAVPGSGKTTVIVSRAAYLTEVCGVSPSRLLTVTYNRAAAGDMTRRYEELFGSCPCRFRTIHSLCCSVIDRYSAAGGRRKFDLMPDESSEKTVALLYRQITQDYAEEYTVRQCMTGLTYIVNMMLGKDEMQKLDHDTKLPLSALYHAYRQYKRENRLMDFDDQLSIAYAILKKCPEILAEISREYRYVSVDEAQDTSKLQHEIIGLIAHDCGNLFMVGDEDQSIYSFRAAYPEELLNFKTRYPDAVILRMSQNFRSAPEIVAASQRFIRRNARRLEKDMITENHSGGQVQRLELSELSGRAAYLVKMLKTPEMQTAVLYRTGATALPIADLLLREGIPFSMRGQDSTFFTSPMVSDITAVLRLAMNHSDTEAYRRIYYKLNFRIRRVQAETVIAYAAEQRMGVLDAAELCLTLGQKQRKELRKMQMKLHQILLSDAFQAIRIVMNLGYRRYLCGSEPDELPDDGDLDASAREILNTLLLLAKQTPELPEFLSRLAELKRLLAANNHTANADVVLSTIHSAKGLEFDRVLLVGVADGVFPSLSAEKLENPSDLKPDEAGQLEEDRRLFYVACTRAKRDLRIESHAAEFGVPVPVPSFVRDFFGLPEEKPETAAAPEPKVLRYRWDQPPPGSEKPSVRLQEAAERMKKETAEFTVSSVVRHRSYGEGVVMGCDGDRCRVRFRDRERLLSLGVCIENGILSLVKKGV